MHWKQIFWGWKNHTPDIPLSLPEATVHHFQVIHILLIWSLILRKKDQLKAWKHKSICKFPCDMSRKHQWLFMWLTVSLIFGFGNGRKPHTRGNEAKKDIAYLGQREAGAFLLGTECTFNVQRANYRELWEMDPPDRDAHSSRKI